MKDLVKKIKVVLNEEKRAYQVNGRLQGGLGTFNIRINSSFGSTEGIPNLLNNTSDPNAIKSKNANLLLSLYSTLNNKSQSTIRRFLLDQLSKGSEYYDIAYLIFFILFKIGFVIEAIKKARIDLKQDPDHGFSNMLAMLAQIISYEYASIDEELYDRIVESIENEDEYNFHLLEKINSARIIIIERELQDINPEINLDREKILKIWERLFHSQEIPLLIKDIEEHFYEGEFSDTKFATCIDRVRILIVEVAKNFALRISERKKNGKISQESDEHKIFDYLRSTRFINDSEWNMIRTLYNLASTTGSHKAIGKREYARLIKNMAYEMILLLLYLKNESNLNI